MSAVVLPTDAGTANWSPSGRTPPKPPPTPPSARMAYAAAHVVADPLKPDNHPGAALDWDATLAFREYLWSCGLGVAEAMDTAQRGMGLDWAATRELVQRTGDIAAGRAWVAGAGTDQLPPGPAGLPAVVDAWREQLDLVVTAGATPVVMASRALAAAADGPADYRAAYGKLLSSAPGPVMLHWLGPQFDPALTGYWGHDDLRDSARELAALCAEHRDVVAGVKVSVLDAELEIEFRRSLPDGVACYTGDDFHYPALISGDASGHEGHSHSEALLGIFDPIAPVAGAALARLDAGDTAGFHALLDPTVALAREIFRAPTRHYKTGVVFLAYLNGHQRHFRMVGGHESARSITHLAQLLRLADTAGVLVDPDLAVARMRPLLAAAGLW
ncbi:DUF993 family protein [Amycolatopsis sp. NPDC059021]|uniref:DUF993 family protein n=1 Tax=Amycolatopsis sp. NPDC059021 TaxID=3346704 RepID=UPI00366EB4B2